METKKLNILHSGLTFVSPVQTTAISQVDYVALVKIIQVAKLDEWQVIARHQSQHAFINTSTGLVWLKSVTNKA